MILNLKHWLPVPYYGIWATKEKREMTQSPTKPSREQKSASCQNKEYVRGDIKKIYMIGATTWCLNSLYNTLSFLFGRPCL